MNHPRRSLAALLGRFCCVQTVGSTLPPIGGVLANWCDARGVDAYEVHANRSPLAGNRRPHNDSPGRRGAIASNTARG